MTNFKCFAVGTTLFALLGCGGGGGGAGSGAASLANQFASIQSDPNFALDADAATVNAMNGTASYSGAVNISLDSTGATPTTTVYYGLMNLNVNFSNATTTDAFSGNANNFVEFFSSGSSAPTETPVPGSMTISGNLTGVGADVGDDLSGTASGSVDGVSFSTTLDGDLVGAGAEGIGLFFEPNGRFAGGVGVGIR